MTEHTPGPWGLETVITQSGVCHKIGPWPHKWRAGVTMSACIYDDYPSQMPQGTDVMIANARLIAASPDLLAALENLMDQVSPPEPTCRCHISPPCNDCVEWSATRDAMDQARTAIAKAKGVSL